MWMDQIYIIYYGIKLCKIMTLKRRKGKYRLNQGGSADLDLHLLRTAAPPHLFRTSGPSQYLLTFSAPLDRLNTSGPSQHIRTFSAPLDFLNTSGPSQHFFRTKGWKNAEKVRICWEGPEVLRRSGGAEKVRRRWEGVGVLIRRGGVEKGRRCWGGGGSKTPLFHLVWTQL
jgi:hypothetical protein